MLKLNVNSVQSFQAENKKLLREYPSLKKYFDEVVAKQIGCKASELTLLDVHPSKKQDDEEGWKIESFFGPEFPIQLKSMTTLHKDYKTKDFAVGEVRRIELHSGEVFIAETNAAPWTIYADSKQVESL